MGEKTGKRTVPRKGVQKDKIHLREIGGGSRETNTCGLHTDERKGKGRDHRNDTKERTKAGAHEENHYQSFGLKPSRLEEREKKRRSRGEKGGDQEREVRRENALRIRPQRNYMVRRGIGNQKRKGGPGNNERRELWSGIKGR